MQFTPTQIDIDKIIKHIESNEKIENVHHLHVWKLDDKHIHLEAHLDFSENVTLLVSNRVTKKIETALHENFDIEHVTFQCEFDKDDDKSVIV